MKQQLAPNKKISVVIPCYNEAENLKALYERLVPVLRQITDAYEIIFTDNASTDNSDKVYREIGARDHDVSVLFFSRNFGNSQYGYSAGTEYASGDAVIWMEGDLQDPPEMILRLVEKWLEGYEVVYGVRPRAAGSFLMKKARQLFYRIFKKLSYLDIPLDAGDFSLLDRKIVDIFNAMPERSRFVRGMRAWIGYRHIGIVYERSEREGGVTSNQSFRGNFWWAKKFIFSFSYAPTEFLTTCALWGAPTAGILALASIVGAFLGFIPFFLGLLFMAVFCFFAVFIVSIAILAELLSTIFEEVKGRPKYLIQEVLNNHRST